MDQIDFKVHQVNFEEDTLNNETDKKLDSFNSLVSYEFEPSYCKDVKFIPSPKSSFNYQGYKERETVSHSSSDEDSESQLLLNEKRFEHNPFGNCEEEKPICIEDEEVSIAPVHKCNVEKDSHRQSASIPEITTKSVLHTYLQDPHCNTTLPDTAIKTGCIMDPTNTDMAWYARSDGESPQIQAATKELIRVPSEFITITKEKTPNTSQSCEPQSMHINGNNTTSCENGDIDVNTVSNKNDQTPDGTRKEVQDGHCLQNQDGVNTTQGNSLHIKVLQSSTTKNNASINNQSLPTVISKPLVEGPRHVDYSPPVKEISFQPIHIQNKAFITMPQGPTNHPYSDQQDVMLDVSQLERSAAQDYHIEARHPLAASTPQRLGNNGHRFKESGWRKPASEVFTYPVDQPVLQVQSYSDYENILQQKVHLEGQLEIMSDELRSVIEQRGELQSVIAELQKKINTPQTIQKDFESDFFLNLETLKRDKLMLEQEVNDLQRLLEEQKLDCVSTKEDLDLSEQNNAKMLGRIGHLRHEMNSKDATIQTLKDKIAEVYVDMQSAKHAKSKVEKEVESLKEEIDGFISSKQWLRDQLQLAQNTRIQLQNDYTRIQTSLVHQINLSEKLSAENVHLKQELVESSQQTLKEKERITQYLESIQAGILERESIFSQLKTEQSSSEGFIQEQIKKFEKEKHEMFKMASKSTDIEHDLNKVRNELKRKEAEVCVIEDQQKEVLKRLNQSNELLTERDNTVERFEQHKSELELELKSVKRELQTRESTINVMSSDKVTLESALTLMREEKKIHDSSIDGLKGSMNVAENSYRALKQDLELKTDQLESQRRDKQVLEQNITLVTKDLEKYKKMAEGYKINIAAVTKLTDKLKQDNESLERKVSSLTHDIDTYRATSMQDSTTGKTENNTLKQEVQVLTQQVESQLAVISNLEGQLEVTKNESSVIEQLRHDNNLLKISLSKTETDSHRELAEYQVKVNKLTEDLSNANKLYQDTQHIFETKIASSVSDNKQLRMSKVKLEKDIKAVKQQLLETDNHSKDFTSQKIQEFEKNIACTVRERDELLSQQREMRDKFKTENDQLIQETRVLQKKLNDTERKLDKDRHLEEKVKQTSLELERERGRLAGIKQSHSSLKNHASTLEAQIAQLESAASGNIVPVVQDDVKDRVTEELRENIEHLNTKLKKESDNNKQLRKQVAVQKGDSIKQRRIHEGVLQDVTQLQQDVVQYRDNAQRSEKALEELRNRQVNDVTVEESSGADSQRQLDKLSREIEDLRNRESVTDDQIKSLHWQLEQKQQEIDVLKEQMTSAGSRHKTELRNIKKMLKITQADLDSVKTELSTTRKDKFTFQAKVSELRGALKASLQHNKLLKSQVVTGTSSGDPGALTSSLEEVLNTTSPPPLESSQPMGHLEECLATLRAEVGNLQLQVQTQNNASSESWREVESHIQDLRNICRSPKLSVTANELKVYSPAEDEDPSLLSTPSGERITTPSLPGCMDV